MTGLRLRSFRGAAVSAGCAHGCLASPVACAHFNRRIHFFSRGWKRQNLDGQRARMAGGKIDSCFIRGRASCSTVPASCAHPKNLQHFFNVRMGRGGAPGWVGRLAFQAPAGGDETATPAARCAHGCGRSTPGPSAARRATRSAVAFDVRTGAFAAAGSDRCAHDRKTEPGSISTQCAHSVKKEIRERPSRKTFRQGRGGAWVMAIPAAGRGAAISKSRNARMAAAALRNHVRIAGGRIDQANGEGFSAGRSDR